MRKVKIVRLRDVKTDLILFGDIRSDYIESIALADCSYQKIYVDIFKSFSGRIVLSFPSITKSIYYFLFKYNKKESWKINIALAYYYGVINSISPKVLLTFEGTPKYFFSLLTTLTKNAHILALSVYQLRERNIRDMEPSIARDPSLVHYYVWGEKDKKDLTSIGQLEKNIHVVGSIMSGLYFSMKPSLINNKKYDICIVAALKHLPIKTLDLNESILVGFLSNYLSLNPALTVCIATRPESSIKLAKQLVEQRNKDCYSAGLNGHNVTFIENTLDNFGTYKAMDSSTVVIAQNSCAAFEALGWGKRVLFCQPNKLWFKTPDDLYYGVMEHNQEKFNKNLDELFTISDDKYKENINNNISKYCQSDISNPPHVIFQKKINELLLE
jgi:hypothetical protein